VGVTPSARHRLQPRRVGALLAAVLVACLVLAGCSGGSEPGPGGAGGSVTVRHAYGETTVPAAPQRVVAVGFNDADFVLALGVVPVGVRDFVGAFDETTRPWAQQALGGARPEQVGGQEVDIEKVAALRPDVIIGLYSFMDRATYDTLSRIAPTVADPNPGGVPAPSWQEQTRLTGTILGRAQQADEVVRGVEQRFADARTQNPAFAGKGVAVDLVAGGEHNALGTDDLRTQLFTGLGLGVGPTTETLSTEQLSRLDRDGVAVLGVGPRALAGTPTFQNLRAVREGRVAFLGEEASPVAGALGFGSPLSLPYALDQVVPQLRGVYRS
jgi:iron complex transport system substrate-binding protein